MAKLDDIFLKKVWQRLRDSSVPIVSQDDYKNRGVIAKKLAALISDHTYLPSTIHGYLGIQKGGGVTRFLPILTAKDMGVYYYLCYSLAPEILVKKKGIFGAWHMKPEVSKELEEEAEASWQAYGTDPFSSYWWLKEWKQFNSLISALISDPKIGNYVVSTDIANFYDSIEVPRLISKIRAKVPTEIDTVDALNAFLSSWNRRHVGYMASTKGIPQEIISDASRVLSHFYLQDFDVAFSKYCDANNLTYVRWSDDFLIFGGSNQKLQSAVHHASKLLRDLGLNLNAPKTKYRTKRELKEHRCLTILDAISTLTHSKVDSELRKIKKSIAKKDDIRLDTVFRAMIGYVSNNPVAQTTINKSFIVDVATENIDLLHSLNNTQMMRFIELADKPLETFNSLRQQICKADFGAPKASYLHMLRKYRSRLAKIGMTKKRANAAILDIEKNSSDSSVLTDFCVPVVKSEYK